MRGLFSFWLAEFYVVGSGNGRASVLVDVRWGYDNYNYGPWIS